MITKNESNKLAKECIVTALIELMKVRDFHSITITDLTKKAGVSRMAYYRNYTSKEDILNKFVDDIGTNIHEELVAKHASTGMYDVYEYYLALLTHLSSYNDLAITAYHAGLGELILSQISKQMALTFPSENRSPAHRYRHLYMAGAFYNVFIEWLKKGQRESPEEVAKILCILTYEGCNPAMTKGVSKQ